LKYFSNVAKATLQKIFLRFHSKIASAKMFLYLEKINGQDYWSSVAGPPPIRINCTIFSAKAAMKAASHQKQARKSNSLSPHGYIH
jgi:hypothetical protein